MTTTYVCTVGEYSDYKIKAVFSDELFGWTVEPWELNEHDPDTFPPGKPYDLVVKGDGAFYAREIDIRELEATGAAWVPHLREHPDVAVHWWGSQGWFTSREAALDCARQKRDAIFAVIAEGRVSP